MQKSAEWFFYKVMNQTNTPVVTNLEIKTNFLIIKYFSIEITSYMLSINSSPN